MNCYLADHQGVFPPAAVHKYDSSGNIESTEYWPDLVLRSAASKDYRAFVCPAVNKRNLHPSLARGSGGGAYVSYAYNRYGVGKGTTDSHQPARLANMDEPSKVLMAFDYESGTQNYEGYYIASRGQASSRWDDYRERHNARVQILFCDGHVKTSQTLDQLLGRASGDFPWAEYKYTTK